jgi:hypothetical protein
LCLLVVAMFCLVLAGVCFVLVLICLVLAWVSLLVVLMVCYVFHFVLMFVCDCCVLFDGCLHGCFFFFFAVVNVVHVIKIVHTLVCMLFPVVLSSYVIVIDLKSNTITLVEDCKQ